ncbi:SusC/RagA family TonB-linked outer membrane protein [Fulvitalea axinellae]|uniref:SusC/RagA family TonB-linked outer membrane protein n=1 Tax=Fulvitalea axinellae TaxID=1182444 RepID=A0AAU9D1W0_9BACT|nr:SusC/RagA family TonB-linked outer membrane protein [Fulvitalea axinellae]
MKTLYFFAISFLIATASLYAQDNKVVVKGYVKGSSDNMPLIGANVVEVGDDGRFIQGTVTDFNGFYMLKVDPTHQLNISYIGYNAKKVAVGSKTTIDVILEDAAQQLGVVTVEADPVMSDGIKIRDVAMSVKTVELDDIAPIGATSADQMLQGHVSGVDIMTVSGDPGAGMQIRIRGTATILGNREPLIVVDGIPFDTEIDDSFSFASADVRDFGALLSISPDDIKSIEVLKDAASAAIWGSRAANGVLQIVTKRGRKSKPRVTYSYKTSYNWQGDPVPMLSGPEYVTLQKEMYFNVSGNIHSGNYKELNYDQSWENYYNYAQNTDWLDEITQTAQMKEHHVSLMGGGEKIKYRSSVGFRTEGGTTIGTGLDRLTVKTNLDYAISSRLKFITDISYTRADNDRSYYNNIRSISYQKMPNESVYEYDADGNLTGNYFNADWRKPYQEFKHDNKYYPFYNPVALANESSNNYLEDRLRTTFTLRYQLRDDLMLQGDVAFDVLNGRTNTVLSSLSTNEGAWSHSSKNKVAEGNSGTFRVQTYTKLIYTPDLGEDHELTMMGRWETNESRGSYYSASTGNMASEKLSNAGMGGTLLKVGSGTSTGRSLGGVFSSHYKFKDKYIVSGGMRIDASSNFGENVRWGAFPFGALAWRISNEPFLADVEQLNEFKIRSSFGVNGIAPSGNRHYSIYGTTERYLDDQGVNPNNIQLRNLSWERVYQYNLGFDLYALDNRLNVVFDLYRKVSEDLLWGIGLPSSAGYNFEGVKKENSELLRNWGKMTNEGVELSVDYAVVKTKDWGVDVGFNISKNINTVEEIPENFSLEKGNLLNNGEYGRRIVIGDPIGGFYGYKSAGVYSTKAETIARDRNGDPIPDYKKQGDMKIMTSGSGYVFQPGDARYEDINHDGVIDELDVVYLGSSNPDFTGGFSFRIRYKGWSLSSLFHTRVGQKIINENRMHSENMTNRSNQSKATLRRWRAPGDQTDIPRALYNQGKNWLGSDRFVEDGSFLRWKNVSLSYRFSRDLLKRIGLQDLKMYATAYNLVTWTDYTGQDPEVGLGADPFYFGVDKSVTPPSRSMIFGVSATF